ncbi:unnamed protein product [Cylindrotheca closterium]|uniref:Uncharacterized protein n=1 Tax=Cylindrotheca closterium TaxID=2856 RepID=A0AAD2FMA1_9STRA|nr:unnamed protein product [Cylindrotheca closterium]
MVRLISRTISGAQFLVMLLSVMATFVHSDEEQGNMEESIAVAEKHPSGVKPYFVFSTISIACMGEIEMLCAGAEDVEDLPCPSEIESMPFESCKTNSCLYLHSMLEVLDKKDPAGVVHRVELVQKMSKNSNVKISQECQTSVFEYIRAQEFLRILESGPQNWMERVQLLEVRANMISLWFMGAIFNPMSLLFHCWVVLFVAYKGFKSYRFLKQVKEERQCVLECVLANEGMKTRLEELTNQKLDISPYSLTWDLQSQTQQFAKVSNQVKVLRAIYSDPDLKLQFRLLDRFVQSDLIMSLTPPVNSRTLERGFNPPRPWFSPRPATKFSLFYAGYVFFVMDLNLPPWMKLLVEVCAVKLVISSARKAYGTPGGYRKSTCCHCGKTSLQADDKKNEDVDCLVCSGTGVCHLACTVCEQRLQTLFPSNNVFLPGDAPPGYAPVPAPLHTRTHGRLY